MKPKNIVFFAIVALSALCADAVNVSVRYYMGDAYGGFGINYVSNYNNNGTAPILFTVTNSPAGWKPGGWLIGSAGDIRNLTDTGVSGSVYNWTHDGSAYDALAVRFVPVSYSISFDTAGGDDFAAQGPYLSTNVVNLAEYTGSKTGHSFAGWTNAYVTAAFDHTESFTGLDKFGLGSADTNVTLFAVWTPYVYDITFKYRNAKGQIVSTVVKTSYGETAAAPEQSMYDSWPGWHFTGWDKSFDGVSSALTVNANYAQNIYTVSYDPNSTDASGSMADSSFTYNDTSKPLRKNAYSRTGYVFSGWNDEKDGSGTAYSDEQEVSDLTTENGGVVTLYAQWTPITYHVAFDGNGATGGSMTTMDVAYDERAFLPSNAFTKSNFEFSGWTYSGKTYPDCAAVFNLATNEGETVTFTARWGDYRSDLQNAMHCTNLVWTGVKTQALDGSNKWAARSGDGLGYNGSGSCAEQAATAGDALVATVATNGVLSFQCRNASSSGSAIFYLAVNAIEDKMIDEGENIYQFQCSLDDDEWHEQTLEIAADYFIYVSGGVTNRHEKLYIHIAVPSGTVQIDQMKWEPEGGSGDSGSSGGEELWDPGLAVAGWSGKYDGEAHSVSSAGTTNISPSVVTLRYAVSADGPFSGAAPAFTNAGSWKVWCEASAAGCATVTNSAVVEILKREVTLTSGSATKVYDGTPLTNGVVTVGGDGFIDGEGATWTVTGSQTEVGSSNNDFGYELTASTSEANYNITKVLGTLAVSAPSDADDPGESGDPGGSGDSGNSGVSDITAPYAAPKAVVLRGVVLDVSGGSTNVSGVVELKLGKVNVNRATGKISGSVTGLDGKKYTIKSFTVKEIDGVSPKTVVLEVKKLGSMTVTIGGVEFAGTLEGGYRVQSADVGGDRSGSSATVSVGTVPTSAGTVPADLDLSMFSGEVLAELLPTNEVASVAKGKWKFAKAASVKWAKPKKGVVLEDLPVYDAASGKGLIIDTSKDRTNLSGLKLTYTPKKGTFKGSFKVYELQTSGSSTKLKKYTVKVNGFVVDGVGVGEATCKKPALSWSVAVE